MTIDDLEKFIASLPDWAILDGCFGNTKIKPMDIDGMVERNGVCLFLERKGVGATLKEGQARAFRALAAQGNTVITYWADDERVTRFRFDDAGGTTMYDPATLEDFRAVVSHWFETASLPG